MFIVTDICLLLLIQVMEFSPSTSPDALRIRTIDETRRSISEEQEEALAKAHTLLGFHANSAGLNNMLSQLDVSNAIQAITDEQPTAEFLDTVMATFSRVQANHLTQQEFRSLVTSGVLQQRSAGRYWVALSLAEAETIRRIIHVRKDSLCLIDGADTAVALRYSPLSGPTAPISGDGGTVLDVSKLWANRSDKQCAPKYEASMVHSAFRFFDCDMHFAPSALNILIRELLGSARDKEIFFQSVIGCRRRMDVKVI